MTAAISNTATTSHVSTVPANSPQIKKGGSDSDGDNDASKMNASASAVNLPANLGAHVNTTA